MTTHGQPAVAHNGTPRSAAPVTGGPNAAPTAPPPRAEPPLGLRARRAMLDEDLGIPGPIGDVARRLRRLRTIIATTTYPLDLPDAEEAQRTGDGVIAQIDDYLLPRLARMDAPLLAVVGGSTGTGKSTLVNSLVRAPVSSAGVLRPTTRAPVLVCHPDDNPWFRHGRLLPRLTRSAGPSEDPYTLRLVTAPGLTPGLALLDAPDIDSVVSANRGLAAQLLSAADLWLFVTSAARYADAMPWNLLRMAAFRGTVVALVLDRVPPESASEVVAHLTELLVANQLGTVPVFVLPETIVDCQGLLASDVVAPIGQWLAGLAGDPQARAVVVGQTVDGALATIEPIVAVLAEAAEDQATAATALADRTAAAYQTARRRVEHGIREDVLLRGEALARWREFTGTGHLARTLELHAGRMRQRVIAAVSGSPMPGAQLGTALEASLAALVRAAAAHGAEQAYAGWQSHPSGAALLRPDLAKPSGDLAERAADLAHDWRNEVLDLVRTDAGDQHTAAHGAEYAMNATGLLVAIGVLTSREARIAAQVPAKAVTVAEDDQFRPEVDAAAGSLLEAVLDDEAVRVLVWKAYESLLTHVDTLLDAEAARYLQLLPAPMPEVPPARQLREAAEQVERARLRAGLAVQPDDVNTHETNEEEG